MGREIVLAIDVASDADSVFDAITSQAGLAAFWTPDVTASAGAGARLRLGFEPAPVDLELTLDAADRGKRIVWTAGDAWPDDYADADLGSVAYTWSLVLGALKGYVETGEPQPALH